MRKVDLPRGLYAREAFTKVPVLTTPEVTPERSALFLRDHPVIIVTDRDGPHLLMQGATDQVIPVSSVDAGFVIGQCFPLLAVRDAIVVTEGGRARGILTREMTFRAMAHSDTNG